MGTYVFCAATTISVTDCDMSRGRVLCVLSHCDVADTVCQCPEFPFPGCSPKALAVVIVIDSPIEKYEATETFQYIYNKV